VGDVQATFGGVLSWLIFGALAGWIASKLAGDDQQGCLTNIIVGIIGAFLGGFLFSKLTGNEVVLGWSLGALVVSVIGAIVLLFVLKLLRR